MLKHREGHRKAGVGGGGGGGGTGASPAARCYMNTTTDVYIVIIGSGFCPEFSKYYIVTCL